MLPTSIIGKKSIAYVMAVDAEYGPHLQARFLPLMTGVGPIEAALVLTEALTEARNTDQLPDLIVCLGSAGSRNLKRMMIYQAKSVSWRDMDASALGFPKGETPFLGLPAELPLPYQIPGIPSARLSTGANIVTGAAYDGIDADMVDMESFAIFRACQRFDLPMIALRGISDGVADLNHISDWTQHLNLIDENLAKAVDLLEKAIAEDKL